MNLKLLSAAVVTGMLAAACASPSGPRTDLLGSPATPAAATRTIVVTPTTRWVNVTGGEIVKFVVGDQVFAWNFNAAPTVNDFDLRQVAPPGVFDHQVQAYLAPDPRYIGGGGRGGIGGMHGSGHGGGHR